MWFIYIVCVIIALVIGSEKNRPVLGLILGILLGFIGVIIIACIDKKEVQASSSSGSSFYYDKDNPEHNPPGKPGSIFKD